MSPAPQFTPRYRLLALLGQGGMGTVYQAVDRLTGNTVALKQVIAPEALHVALGPNAPRHAEALRRALTQEFQTLAGLRHPHIISVLDYGFSNEQKPFYTMTYLPDAQTILAAGQAQPLARKIELIQQLLQALIYLHRRGVLHRDLKPENILVSQSTVRVVDFGLAASRKSRGYSRGGTAFYTAPEIWEERPYTTAADLFAVGILAGQLLTGHHPFEPFDDAFIDRVLEGEPNLENIAAELAPTLVKLLAKNPAERYTQAEDVLEALAQATAQPLPEETRSIRESFLQAATFVGRQTELAELTAALNRAANGRGSAWLVGGESGVGKSRLLNELRTQALVDGFQVLHSQATREASLPFQLWREALRHLLITARDVDDLTASVLLPLVPDIPQLLERAVSPAPVLDDQAARVRQFTSMARLFWQAERPVLLILEDLHWAEESLIPLAYLVRLVGDHRVLIVGSYRNDEYPDLPQRLPEMQRLNLARLTAENMAELSAAMLGEAGTQPEVLALLQRETEGNAFFAVEVVRALAEQTGRLSEIDPAAVPETFLPNGIQNIIQRRLNKLPPVALALLTKAAVAGREIELPLIQRLADGLNIEAEWLPLCAEAAVLEIRHGQWQFNHDKIREDLLAHLPSARRSQLHHLIAEVLEQLHPDEAQQAARLAHHWHMAGDAAQELRYVLAAGQYAAAQYAHTEALRFFERAIALLAPTEVAQQYDVLTEQFKVLSILGERAKQAEVLHALTHLAHQLNDTAKTGAVLYLQALYFQDLGQYAPAETYFQQAVELAPAIQDEAYLAQISVDWAFQLGEQRKLEEALEKAQQSQAIYRRLHDTLGEARIANVLGLIHTYRGEREQSLACYQTGLRLFQKLADSRGLWSISNNLGVFYSHAGEYDEAQTHFEQSLSYARQIGDSKREAISLNNTGYNAYLIGAYDLAIQLSQESYQINLQIDDRFNRGNTLDNLGLMHSKKGEWERAQAYFLQSLQLKASLKDAWAEAYTWNMMGHSACQANNLPEALNAYQSAQNLLQTNSFSPILVECWAGLAEVHWRLKQLAPAQAYAEKVWAHFEEKGIAGEWEWAASGLKVYRIFIQQGDEARAARLLHRLHSTIQMQASQIADLAVRAMFLGEVPEHREVIRLFAAHPNA